MQAERAFWRLAAGGSGLVGVVGLVDEVVEDSEGVLDGLVVGHRRADVEHGVVVLGSECCACVRDGVPLVPSATPGCDRVVVR